MNKFYDVCGIWINQHGQICIDHLLPSGVRPYAAASELSVETPGHSGGMYGQKQQVDQATQTDSGQKLIFREKSDTGEQGRTKKVTAKGDPSSSILQHFVCLQPGQSDERDGG